MPQATRWRRSRWRGVWARSWSCSSHARPPSPAGAAVLVDRLHHVAGGAAARGARRRARRGRERRARPRRRGARRSATGVGRRRAREEVDAPGGGRWSGRAVGWGLLGHAGERDGAVLLVIRPSSTAGQLPRARDRSSRDPRLRQVSVDNSLPIVAALAAIVAVIATVVAWRAGRRARRAADLVAQLLEPPVLEPVARRTPWQTDRASEPAPDLAARGGRTRRRRRRRRSEPPVEPTPTIAAPAARVARRPTRRRRPSAARATTRHRRASPCSTSTGCAPG